MSVRQVTLDDLRRILVAGAGADESVDLDADVLDTEFTELGYDSLALLETVARVNREFGIVVDDETATSAATPRALLDVINGS